MTQPTHQEYILKDYADFMALTPEQFERMLPDFLSWKKAHTQILQGLEMAANLSGIAPEEIAQLPDHFLWVDDGISGEGIVDVEIKDSFDGKVVATNQIKFGR